MPLLHWINDDAARRAASEVPFHLLERKAVYGDTEQAKDNLIVHGDNLVALKALLPFYKGKVSAFISIRRTTREVLLNTMTTTWSIRNGCQ